MEDFNFRPLTLADKSIVEHFTRRSECRNCDLNFMNLMSWRFLYDTEIAVVHGWLVFRFFADGHLAYQIPVGEGPWTDILPLMIDDARKMGHPFYCSACVSVLLPNSKMLFRIISSLLSSASMPIICTAANRWLRWRGRSFSRNGISSTVL